MQRFKNFDSNLYESLLSISIDKNFTTMLRKNLSPSDQISLDFVILTGLRRVENIYLQYFYVKVEFYHPPEPFMLAKGAKIGEINVNQRALTPC